MTTKATDDAARDAERVAFPLDRLTALSAGAVASQFDVMRANFDQTVKHRNWLMARGRLDDAGAATLSRRADRERARIGRTLDQMASAAASPTPAEGAMTFAGRVHEDGDPRLDLVVSVLDRKGKALACATSGGGGVYRVAVDAKTETEVVLMVASAKGRRLYLDDRVTKLASGGIARLDLDIGKGRDACPDGPDQSERPIMPDIIGHGLSEAAALLKRAGIGIAAIETVDRAGAAERVVATEPPAGRLLGDPPEARLVVGRPDQDRWDTATVRDLVALDAVDEGLPEERVAAMFDTMAEKDSADTASLAKASAGGDRAFATASGLKPPEAKIARAALAKTLGMLGADRDTAD